MVCDRVCDCGSLFAWQCQLCRACDRVALAQFTSEQLDAALAWLDHGMTITISPVLDGSKVGHHFTSLFYVTSRMDGSNGFVHVYDPMDAHELVDRLKGLHDRPVRIIIK